MTRLTQLADEFYLTIDLAYSPPYHSKSNPIARVWGVLEPHWNGSLLESRQTVLRLAATMTWNGWSPMVKFVEKTYHTAISLSHHPMTLLEKRLIRLPTLPKWFVHLVPRSP